MRSLRRGNTAARSSTSEMTGNSPVMAPKPPRVIFAFAVYTAVALLLVALLVVVIVRHNVTENTKDNVSDHTRFIAKSVLPQHIKSDEWNAPVTGQRLAQLDSEIARFVMTDEARRVKLYSPAGEVIYSDDHTLIGTTTNDMPELREVLEGSTLTQSSSLNSEGGAGTDFKVIETYTPVFYESGKPAGAFELYSDYDLAAGAVRKQAAPLAIALLLAMLGLYLALLPILRRTTRALSYSNAELRRRADDLHVNLVKRAEIEDRLRDTIKELERSENLLAISQEETIMRLSMAVESRHAETGSHIERMGRYSALVAKKLGWDDDRCELLRIASPLHDVGKIAIADNVLQKPGALTPDERAEMEKHAEIGHRILAGSDSELLDLAARIALTHHEHWDGTGYPNGLGGDEIPIEGRIAAVADVFDALTSDRVYRPAMPVEKALSIMEEGRDSHFDPLVLDTFFESVNEVLAIRDGRFVEDVKEEQERRRQGRRRRRKVSRGVNASSNGEAVVAMRPASVDVDPRPDDSTDDSGDARQSLVG